MRRSIIILALGLTLPVSGCASHKEVTAPCKRPESLAAYAEEPVSSTSSVSALNALVGKEGGCGPLYPVNDGDGTGDISAPRTATQ